MPASRPGPAGAPSLPADWAESEVRISAAEMGVPLLGAVLAYGPLVTTLQAAWQAEAARDPARLVSRFGAPVQSLRALAAGSGAEVVAADAVASFDLVVVAEGGVFADQARKALAHDYRQTAWVGTVTLEGAPPGTAFERFTRQGPLALLPLPDVVGPSGVAGQVMAQQLAGGLAGSNPAAAAAAAAAAAPVALKPDEVMATLEKLAELKQKGILTEDEFSTKKAELLKKLV